MDPPATPSRVVQVQPQPAPTQQAASVMAPPPGPSAAPSHTRGMLPALEHLQRISQGAHQRNVIPPSSAALPPLPPSARGAAFPGGRDAGFPPSSVPPVQHQYQERPVAPALPSYHQVTAVGGGDINRGGRGEGDSSGRQSGNQPAPHSPHSPLPSTTTNPAALPDLLLHSHVVPPQVPPARPNQHRNQRRRGTGTRESRDSISTGGVRLGGTRSHNQRRSQGSRHPPRGRRRSRGASTSSTNLEEGNGNGSCKEPCMRCAVTVTSFRWVLVALSILGVCCVVTGVVLAALRSSGNSFLFLAVMFMGLGILLVIVVAVGWKCTPRGHEPLHAIFGLGEFRHGRSPGHPSTRGERRRRRHRNRNGNWYNGEGTLYPEFQYRRPPPSYAASMHDYQQQQQQHQQQQHRRSSSGNNNTSRAADGGSLPSSPPPSYRSRASTAHSGIHIAFPNADTNNTEGSEMPRSRPPTYRSRAPSRRPSLPRHDTGGTGDTAGVEDVAFTGGDTVDGSSPRDGAAASSDIPTSTAAGPMTASTDTSSPPSSSHTTGTSSSPPSSGADNQNRTFTSSPFSLPATTTTPLSISPGANSNTGPQHHLQNPTSSSSSPPSASQPVQPSSQEAAAAAVPQGRLPSLHQRMESSDQRMLEEALQSLEQHISLSEGDNGDSGGGTGSGEPGEGEAAGAGGVINEAATFDSDLSASNDHFNTHL